MVGATSRDGFSNKYLVQASIRRFVLEFLSPRSCRRLEIALWIFIAVPSAHCRPTVPVHYHPATAASRGDSIVVKRANKLCTYRLMAQKSPCTVGLLSPQFVLPASANGVNDIHKALPSRGSQLRTWGRSKKRGTHSSWQISEIIRFKRDTLDCFQIHRNVHEIAQV